MSWLNKLIPAKILPVSEKKKSIPEGLWSRCTNCNEFLFKTDLENNLNVCPKCNHHMYIGARERLNKLFDAGTTTEIAADVVPIDRLKFKDTKKYKDRLITAQKKTNEKDALIAMQGEINSKPLVAVAFEFTFIGGSMGTVVGEKFFQAVNVCLAQRKPLVCFAASGGARMQESLFSLMQMPKTSAALAKLAEAKIPYIVVLTNPCTGGVSASLAMLGDIHIAEPNALIGFAGPRVIAQTVRETLPEGFQRSDFLLEKGMVDMIVDRRNLKAELTLLINHLFYH